MWFPAGRFPVRRKTPGSLRSRVLLQFCLLARLRSRSGRVSSRNCGRLRGSFSISQSILCKVSVRGTGFPAWGVGKPQLFVLPPLGEIMQAMLALLFLHQRPAARRKPFGAIEPHRLAETRVPCHRPLPGQLPSQCLGRQEADTGAAMPDAKAGTFVLWDG